MERIPFVYKMIRGAIGRKFVVKHYKGGKVVVTRFPDMSGIAPTEKQKVRRDLFREAVVWAKWVIADEERKLAFKMTLPRKKRKKVYQAALQLYMKMRGNKQWVRKVLESMEKQWAMNCVDISKQLAVMAIAGVGVKCTTVYRQLAKEGFNSELSNINGGGKEQQRQWSVVWQKRREWIDLIVEDVDTQFIIDAKV